MYRSYPTPRVVPRANWWRHYVVANWNETRQRLEIREMLRQRRGHDCIRCWRCKYKLSSFVVWRRNALICFIAGVVLARLMYWLI